MSLLLSENFGEYTIRENRRPEWMITDDGHRLELDFLIEELNVAIEIQGEQHYRFVPFFHSDYSQWELRKRLDEDKVRMCDSNNVTLYHASSEQECHNIVDKILLKIPISSPQNDTTKWVGYIDPDQPIVLRTKIRKLLRKIETMDSERDQYTENQYANRYDQLMGVISDIVSSNGYNADKISYGLSRRIIDWKSSRKL